MSMFAGELDAARTVEGIVRAFLGDRFYNAEDHGVIFCTWPRAAMAQLLRFLDGTHKQRVW
eukprot:CAMPEP_0184718602 /NCGR_PEP_ID=MMETSP0314-20130426/7754_1 /TAXON_ID=38298 /ORGANISM="Rhodella maculata, Strain CCMP 736" /LENGTH=60 /DNA_ID=CAMNT_0027182361 /DNA_START=409 /DNA_END=591 /DNA_ORIENTATION=-